MVNFLFWNVNGNAAIAEIASLAHEHDVDVLILAEFPRDQGTNLLVTINSSVASTYTSPFNPSTKLFFLTRFPVDDFRLVLDEGGLSARRVIPPVGREILLIASHLPSKLHMETAEQAINSIRIVEVISAAEVLVGHSDSLVIGDLNMDPFDTGMVAADGFHAVMDKSVALTGSRIVNGKDRPFFYNPMWSRLGDESEGPAGTYFYRGGPLSTFWHAFDQVKEHLKVLTKWRRGSLLKDGRPDRRYSDHLPLFLRLETERSVTNGR